LAAVFYEYYDSLVHVAEAMGEGELRRYMRFVDEDLSMGWRHRLREERKNRDRELVEVVREYIKSRSVVGGGDGDTKASGPVTEAEDCGMEKSMCSSFYKF
jgi:hypothetical protein